MALTPSADEERAMLLRLVTMLQKKNIRTHISPIEGSFRIEIKDAWVCNNATAIYATTMFADTGNHGNQMIKLASIEFKFSNHDYEYTLFMKQDGLYVQLGELNVGNLQPPECNENARYMREPSILQVTPDLNKFESRINMGLGGTHFSQIETRPAWTYILLSMLVYNDHVFDPLADTAVLRRRTGSDAACELFSHVWKRGPDSLYGAHWPFLVRLMSREFAFHVDPLDRQHMF